MSIRLKWLNNAQFAGIYVANENKIYEKHGLKIEIRERDFNEKSPIDELLSNEVDFIIISASELIVEKNKGKDIIAIAAIFQQSPATIIALEDSGIKSPKDFKNKILGIVSDTDYSKYFFRDLLNQFGLTDSDVTYKVIAANHADSLVNGSVDLVSTYRTDGYAGFSYRGKNYTFFRPEEYGNNIYDDVLVTTSKKVRENPELVRAFTISSLEGWKKAIVDPNSAVSITYKYSNPKYKNMKFLNDSLNQVLTLVKPNSGLTIGKMEHSKWKVVENKLAAQGLIIPSTPTNETYTNQFIQ